MVAGAGYINRSRKLIMPTCSDADVPNTMTKLNEDITNVSGQMPINYKTVAVCFGSGINISKINFVDLTLYVNQNQINFKTNVINLGVVFDNEMTFKDHTSLLCRNAIFKLICFISLFYLPPYVRWKLFETLILNNFDYCLAVYGLNLTVTNLHRLQLVQHSCMRFSFGIHRRQHITPYYSEKNISKISDRLHLSVFIILYKILACKIPKYLFSLFKFRSQYHSVSFKTC
jgi:hypothetical protein